MAGNITVTDESDNDNLQILSPMNQKSIKVKIKNFQKNGNFSKSFRGTNRILKNAALTAFGEEAEEEKKLQNSNNASLPKMKLVNTTLEPPRDLAFPSAIKSPRRKVMNYHRRHLAANFGGADSSFEGTNGVDGIDES